MLSAKNIWIFCCIFIAFRECYGFSKRISRTNVNGKSVKFCEYKLMKMVPRSTFSDMEACLKCTCGENHLRCKSASSLPGCRQMPGGLITQNPFANKYAKMVNDLIKKMHQENYTILQVRTQVVAGYNIFIWIRVDDRLCDLVVYENLSGKRRLTTDSCSIGAN